MSWSPKEFQLIIKSLFLRGGGPVEPFIIKETIMAKNIDLVYNICTSWKEVQEYPFDNL